MFFLQAVLHLQPAILLSLKQPCQSFAQCVTPRFPPLFMLSPSPASLQHCSGVYILMGVKSANLQILDFKWTRTLQTVLACSG